MPDLLDPPVPFAGLAVLKLAGVDHDAGRDDEADAPTAVRRSVEEGVRRSVVREAVHARTRHEQMCGDAALGATDYHVGRRLFVVEGQGVEGRVGVDDDEPLPGRELGLRPRWDAGR